MCNLISGSDLDLCVCVSVLKIEKLYDIILVYLISAGALDVMIFKRLKLVLSLIYTSFLALYFAELSSSREEIIGRALEGGRKR